MATYKVLQDIEAEDKLLGPLTLKQFIFAIIFIGLGFIEFKLVTATALSVVRWPFVLVLLFPMVIFGFLAAPISRDQPNDVWLLARIRFLLKPHIRIWNQDGVSNLVTITAPKRIERVFTNGLDQQEVKSRLTALASTLDSRGWAIKNVDVNLFAQPGYLTSNHDGSDRLVAPSSLPVSGIAADVKASDDILDPHSNPTAQHLDQMVQASTAAHQQQVRTSIQSATTQSTPPADYWFLNGAAGQAPAAPTGMATFQNSTLVTPGTQASSSAQPTAEELALIDKIEADKQKESSYNSHIKTVLPLSQQHATPNPVPSMQQPIQTQTNSQTTTPNPAILSLANNDDLNVATIARQAKRISESDGEVTISLH